MRVAGDTRKRLVTQRYLRPLRADEQSEQPDAPIKRQRGREVPPMPINGISRAATAGEVVSERRSFTETTGAGTYTGSVTVPAGATTLDIKLWSTVLWTASTSAIAKVGDVADDDGWFTGVNLKATDLLVGEELNFIQTGGKEGAYLSLTTGARTVAYSASARVISCIIITVGASGSAGRSFFEVVYQTPPSTTAATKV
jgi:hypothetical protein